MDIIEPIEEIVEDTETVQQELPKEQEYDLIDDRFLWYFKEYEPDRIVEFESEYFNDCECSLVKSKDDPNDGYESCRVCAISLTINGVPTESILRKYWIQRLSFVATLKYFGIEVFTYIPEHINTGYYDKDTGAFYAIEDNKFFCSSIHSNISSNEALWLYKKGEHPKLKKVRNPELAMRTMDFINRVISKKENDTEMLYEEIVKVTNNLLTKKKEWGMAAMQSSTLAKKAYKTMKTLANFSSKWLNSLTFIQDELCFRTKLIFWEPSIEDKQIMGIPEDENRKYIANMYDVKINICSGTVAITGVLYNQCQSYGCRGHPHVLSTRPCWGSVEPLMIEAINKCDYIEIIRLVIEFLSSCNIDDSAGKAVAGYPYILNNIIYVQSTRWEVLDISKDYFDKLREYMPQLDVMTYIDPEEAHDSFFLSDIESYGNEEEEEEEEDLATIFDVLDALFTAVPYRMGNIWGLPHHLGTPANIMLALVATMDVQYLNDIAHHEELLNCVADRYSISDLLCCWKDSIISDHENGNINAAQKMGDLLYCCQTSAEYASPNVTSTLVRYINLLTEHRCPDYMLNHVNWSETGKEALGKFFAIWKEYAFSFEDTEEEWEVEWLFSPPKFSISVNENHEIVLERI